MNRRLRKYRRSFLSVAARDTAHSPRKWDKHKGLTGHCGAVSYMIQRLMGGDLVGGAVKGERHIWNRLPNGTEVDLTSDQFGGDGFTPLKKGRLLPPRQRWSARCAVFEDRLSDIGVTAK